MRIQMRQLVESIAKMMKAASEVPKDTKKIKQIKELARAIYSTQRTYIKMTDSTVAHEKCPSSKTLASSTSTPTSSRPFPKK